MGVMLRLDPAVQPGGVATSAAAVAARYTAGAATDMRAT